MDGGGRTVSGTAVEKFHVRSLTEPALSMGEGSGRMLRISRYARNDTMFYIFNWHKQKPVLVVSRIYKTRICGWRTVDIPSKQLIPRSLLI